MVSNRYFGHGFETEMPKGLELDVERCGHIAKQLVVAYHDLGLESVIPELQYSLPFREDPLALRRFLVFASAQDSMKPSRFMYKGARDMFLEHRYEDLVSFRNKHKIKLDDIAHHYFYESAIRDSAAILDSCIQIIENDCSGDPIRMFEGTRDPDVVRKRLTKIHGVGPYVASLIVKNFTRFGYFKPDVPNAIPIKIDRHALRITLANKGVIFTKETGPEGVHRSRIASAVEKAYRVVTERDNINPIVLDDAKWAVGAYILDRHHPSFMSQWGLDFSQPFTLHEGTYLIWPPQMVETPLFSEK